MKTIAIIPSRYASTRFPGKPLALIAGKPMIQRVYEGVRRCEELYDVIVATDDERIFNAVAAFGGKALMTSSAHQCGTDRLAECAQILSLSDQDIILNIQGDEPLVGPEIVRDLMSCFDDPSVVMGTLKTEITDPAELENPNVVKVVTDCNDYALYFSRYSLPYQRGEFATKHYKHVGMYGYRKAFLTAFSEMAPTSLERSESLEQLRALENGYKIKVKETKYQTRGVDTPEQLKELEKFYEFD